VCGRYTLATPDPADLRARFGLGESVPVRRRFNIAPGDPVLAVTCDREGRPAGELLRWGLVPPWAASPRSGLRMINARAETLAERPAYRRAFERRRCLIVADGFYEWAPREAAGGRAPFHISRRDRRPFAFAGLWSIWRSPERVVRSCAIVTTVANSRIAPLHDRMPVILEPGGEAEWLSSGAAPGRLRELLAPLPAADTVVRAVGPAVNDARHDGPECLAPPPPGPARQPSLF
jgi:putative SOS response-associated peptidase YedK